MRILILILFLLALPVTSQPEPEESELICRVAPDIIKRAHKYHGIDTSIMVDGKLYFWRDGKRCKLFTEGFLNEVSR